MSFRHLTGKQFGSSKATKRLQSTKLDSKSRSKTPVFATDTNSPRWERIYEKAIRNGDANIGEESLKQQVAQRVQMRKELRAIKQAKQTALVQQSPQPHKYMARSMPGPTIPEVALDTNSPRWPRIYENMVRKAHPHMSEADVEQQVAQRVRLRKELRARKQTATKYRGGKKSRRKSRSLLSFFY